MRNLFTYFGFNKENVLNILFNLSKKTDYISVLVSNYNKKTSGLPKDYVNYDIIAGIGCIDFIQSNNNSFEKLNNFQLRKRDWLFGYLSYDLKNEIEELQSNNIDNFNAKNLFFFIPEYVILLNDNKLEIKTHNSKELCSQFVKNFNDSDFPRINSKIHFKARDDKKTYLKKIEKIKSHIQKGDIYEMNYCQEFYSFGNIISPESVFLDLNEKMHTPFSSFLKLKETYVLSASPERFLKKKSNCILSQPIKGTRKRGKTNLLDHNLINELKNSSKDISENVMIVDLVRNDLSVTAKKASVNVFELCEVYTFKEVHQMITSVVSEVDSCVKFSDILKGTFPMGSMTGVPKFRSMELIEYYENFKRGIYSGSVGYVTPELDFDFSVVIRTILYNLANQYVSIGVGGAITIQSDPNEEYEECFIKAKPLFEVLNFKINDL